MNKKDYNNYKLSPGRIIQMPTNIWSNQQQEQFANTTMNDSYLTADETGNNTTQFFSVLEESSNETILNDISEINLEVDDEDEFTYDDPDPDVVGASNTEPAPLFEADDTNQDVVIFKTPNSDTWYGLQVAHDDDGNLQKYQYELVQNADGQFESVPETIQQVAFDTDPLSVAKQLNHELAEEDDEEQEDIGTQCTNKEREQVFIKQELHDFREDDIDEEQSEQEQDFHLKKIVKHEVQPDLYTEIEEALRQEQEDLHFIEDQAPEVYEQEQEVETEEHDDDEDMDYEDVGQEEDDYEEEEEEEEQEEVRSVNHGILERALKGIYSPQKSASTDDDRNVETIQFFISDEGDEAAQQSTEDDETFEICVEVKKSPKKVIKKTIALYPISGSKDQTLKSKTLTTIEVPYKSSSAPVKSKLPNIQKNIIPPLKTLNRLKRSYINDDESKHVSTPQISPQAQKENLQKNVKKSPGTLKKAYASRRLSTSTNKKCEPVVTVNQKFTDALAKKQVQKSAWNVKRMISQTKIIEAPVRQERLPRKQKIEPLERVGEELVFQHVVVSANGVIETKIDGVVKERKVLVPTECIQLSDSEDEQTRRMRKRNSKRKQIEIVISDSEDDDDDDEDVQGSKGKGKMVANSETTISVKDVNNCPKCSKSFPSIGSLKTHLQYHTFAESKRKLEPRKKNEVDKGKEKDHKLTAKYKCKRCDEAFINVFLLTKHEQLHDAKVKNECTVCKKLFNNQAQLNVHKRSHVKDAMYKSTTTLQNDVKLSPKKPNKSLADLPSTTRKSPRVSPKSTPSLLGKPSTFHKLQKCYTCNAGFPSRLLLDDHVVKDCVKSPRRYNRTLAPFNTCRKPAKGTWGSPPRLSLNATLASMGGNNKGIPSRKVASVKRPRIPENAGIPATGEMRAALLNIKRKLQEDDE